LAERRAVEAVFIRAWERRAPMGQLDGRDKCIPWAARVRYQPSPLPAHYVRSGRTSTDHFTDRFEVPGRNAISASWRIDQRDTDPTDLEALLADVSSDVARTVTEDAH
jgi:hypothetical protein